MSDKKITHDPDDVIRELGGCGPFQVKLATTVHLINMVIVFSLHSNVFTTAPPKWHCVTDEGMAYLTNHSSPESCMIENGTTCSHFAYDPDMSTIVSEVIALVVIFAIFLTVII